MTPFVLIIMIFGSTAPYSTSIPFEDKPSCEYARQEVFKQLPWGVSTVLVCAPRKAS